MTRYPGEAVESGQIGQALGIRGSLPRLRPLRPPQQRGHARPSKDHRLIVNATLWVNRTGQVPPVVFLVALASLFGFARYIFVTPKSINLRPQWRVFVRPVTAGVNLGLNFPLIYAFGMLGAAGATVVAYAFGTLSGLLAGRRLWPIDFECFRLATIATAAMMTYLGSLLIQVPNLWVDGALKAVGSPIAFLAVLRHLASAGDRNGHMFGHTCVDAGTRRAFEVKLSCVVAFIIRRRAEN